MNEKDLTFIKDWEEMRERGKVYYSLYIGSIAGIIAFILNRFANHRENGFMEMYFSYEAFLNLTITLPVMIVAYGLMMWPIHEYYYKKKKKIQNDLKLIPKEKREKYNIKIDDEEQEKIAIPNKFIIKKKQKIKL